MGFGSSSAFFQGQLLLSSREHQGFNKQRAMREEESARMKYILSFFLVMLGLLVKFKGFLELGFHTEGDKEARIRDGP